MQGVYLFKFDRGKCTRDKLNDFDGGITFKCTVRKPNVFKAWTGTTPPEYGASGTWRNNVPNVPESAVADDDDIMDEFVFHDA